MTSRNQMLEVPEFVYTGVAKHCQPLMLDIRKCLRGNSDVIAAWLSPAFFDDDAKPETLSVLVLSDDEAREIFVGDGFPQA